MKQRLLIFLCAFSMGAHAENYSYTETGLPVCYIVTKDCADIVSKKEYLTATLQIVQEGKVLFEDRQLSIRGHGQSSWTDYPKHSFKIKLSKKRELLGMPENKHFILLANYSDKTLMRAAVGFRVGELLQCDWTPQCHYVELVLNGEYMGNYLLTESVREGKQRIHVDKSGFIIEYIYRNRLEQEPFYFITQKFHAGYGFKYPDEEDMTDEALAYATYAMDRFEQALFEPTREREYRDFIDTESFAKWYYHINILMQIESNIYYVKQDNTEGSLLRMGPVWDFDWCLDNGEVRPDTTHRMISEYYFEYLSKDSGFMEEVAALHRKYGEKVKEEILTYYDELSSLLEKSQKLNFKRWDILNKKIAIGGTPLGSWEEEVRCDREFFVRHYDFINRYLSRWGTGIRVVKNSSCPHHAIYNLQGQQLKSVPRKGIYIQNGRKVVIK